MTKEITKRAVDALQPGAKDRFLWDGRIGGFGVKATPAGSKVFLLAYRFPKGRAGKVRRFTIGTYGSITLDQARSIAETKRGEIAAGVDPMARLQAQREAAVTERAAVKYSVAAVAKDFVERYAKKRNKSWKQKENILNRLVVPAWGARRIGSIKRAEVVALLDRVEDESGAAMADSLLAVLRKMMNWHATRDDAFNSPIVRGLSRYSSKENARTRVLSDDEIRTMWKALDASPAPYRQLVRFLLLTAARREEAAQAKLDEFEGDLWTIPRERSKNKQANTLPLSRAAQRQLEDLGELLLLGDYAFTVSGKKPFNAFDRNKTALDIEMSRLRTLEPGTRPALKPWRLHDLRRTARTLMTRVGIASNIAERVLGHFIRGVEGTYDRHEYLIEKRHALNALAAEVRRIVGGDSEGKIVHLGKRISA